MYSAMTLGNDSRGRIEPDQTVPELSFDVVTIDGGATVFQSKPSQTPTSPQKTLPDFNSLLDDLTYDISLSGNSATCGALMDTPVEAVAPLRSWELEAYNEISMYDDIPLPNFKPEKYQSVEVKQEQGFPGIADQQLQDLAERISCVCQTLDIPNDPYSWSAEHTQRWLLWALKTYSLPEYHCDKFIMSGAALCYLSVDDFRQRSSHVGDFLSTELDIWKTAHNLALSPEFSSNPTSGHPEDCTSTTDLQDLQYRQEDMPTFTDLDAVSCNTILPQVSAPLKCIPTPVITHSHQYSTLSTVMTSSLNPSLAADSSHMYSLSSSPSLSSSLSVSPAPSMESLATSSSNNSICLRSSPDMDDCSSTSQELPQIVYHNVSPAPHHPHHGKHTIHLWQFLKELLMQPHLYQGCIRWMDRAKGIFKIEDSTRVAKLWGARKNRPAMNYDKLSRSIRQYYKKGIIKKTSNSKRLVYQFCPQYV